MTPEEAELPKEEKSEQEKLIDELQSRITLQDKEIHHYRLLIINILEVLDSTENSMSNLRNNAKKLMTESPMNKRPPIS